MSKELVNVVKSKNTIALAPAEKDPKKLLLEVAEEMGLEPRRGDVMLYVDNQQNPHIYYTTGGLSRMANARHISTKIEIVKQMNSPNLKMAMVKATAVLPDGTSHEDFGYCDSTEPGKQHKPFGQILAMAITRARGRVLRIACKVNATPFEEFNENDEIKRRAIDLKTIENETLQVCPKCGKKGWSRLQKRCLECGITYEQIAAAQQGGK